MRTLKSKWTSPSGFSRWCVDFSALDSNWSSVDPGQLAKPLLGGDCVGPLPVSAKVSQQNESIRWLGGTDWQFDQQTQFSWRADRACANPHLIYLCHHRNGKVGDEKVTNFNFSPWDSSWFSTAVGQATCFWVWGDCAGPSPVSAKVSEQNASDMQTNSLHHFRWQTASEIFHQNPFYLCHHWQILKGSERGNRLRSYFALSSPRWFHL